MTNSPAFQVTEVQQVELPTALDMIDVVHILINNKKVDGMTHFSYSEGLKVSVGLELMPVRVWTAALTHCTSARHGSSLKSHSASYVTEKPPTTEMH